MKNISRQNRRQFHPRGATLLAALFTMTFTSIVLIGILDSIRLQVMSQQATVNYERAAYIAGAGVHHALMLLQDDPSWRGDLAETGYAPGSADAYWANVADGMNDEIVVTGYGRTNGITRVLIVKVN